jgi:hypothetical protein
MLKKAVLSMFLLATVSLALGFGSPVFAMDMNLVGLLVKNLGVTQDQAAGGAGAIFNTASQKMSAADFAKVTDALPEAQSLMDAAPVADEGSGALGGLTSILDKKKSGATSLTALAGAFSKLGLSSDMVGKFIPIVLQYAQSKGGNVVSGLLKSALQ